MNGVLSLEVLRDIMRKVEAPAPTATHNPLTGPSVGQSLFGIPIRQSSAFPMVVTCSKCDGTGEGEESTFCPKCKGAGQQRFEGYMQNGPQTILWESQLPRRFDPSFPAGIVPPAPLASGLA